MHFRSSVVIVEIFARLINAAEDHTFVKNAIRNLEIIFYRHLPFSYVLGKEAGYASRIALNFPHNTTIYMKFVLVAVGRIRYVFYWAYKQSHRTN